MKSLLFALMCWFALVGVSFAGQKSVRVEVRVTSITGASYYLDKGRAAGVDVGDRVTFFPSGGTTVEGTIRSASKNSARVELDTASTAVAVGDRGEADVPEERFVKPTPAPDATPPVVTTTSPSEAKPTPSTNEVAPQAPTTPTTPAPVAVPAHPPWTHPPENWNDTTPLLAPAFGISPEERATRYHGRFYAQGSGTWDNQGDTRRYTLFSTGVDATVDNPFNDGGSFRIDAQVFSRTADADATDFHDSQSTVRLNRLVYEVGGTVDRPTRWLFGRFLQREFPEFGVLDGVEWDQRLSGGSVVGASAGAMPEPTADMKSFDDLQGALFYRHAFDDKRRNTIGIGYQNTWHKGSQDRSLFVGDADLRPADSITIHSTAWVDHYDSSDTIKDAGFELTEMQVSTSWRTTNTSGLALSLSHRRIPELLRSEFQSTSTDLVKNGKLDRIALNGWMNATERIRVDGRVDHWRDQDDSGSTGEVGAAVRNLFADESEFRASVFYADGSFSSGPGFRVQYSQGFGRVYGNLGYEFSDYEQKDFTGEQKKLGQHTVFGSLDLPLFASWDLSLLGEDHFGDEQDSYTLGFLLQTRF